MTDVHLIMWC